MIREETAEEALQSTLKTKLISRVLDKNGASLFSLLLRKTNLKLWSFGVCSLSTKVT